MENQQNDQNGENQQNQENRENIVENADPSLLSPRSGNTVSSQTSSISDFASSGAYRRMESSATQSSQSPSYTLSSLTSYSRETPTDLLSPSGSTKADFQGTRFTVKKMPSSELQQQPSSSHSSYDKTPHTPVLPQKSVKIVDFIHAAGTSSPTISFSELKPNMSFLMSKFRHVLQPKEVTYPQPQHSCPINEEIELRSIKNVVGASDEETTGDLNASNVPLLNEGLQSENNEVVNRAIALEARSQDTSERTSSDNTRGTMRSSPSEGITTNSSLVEGCYCNRRCMTACVVGYIGGAVTLITILVIVHLAYKFNYYFKDSGGSGNGTISTNATTTLNNMTLLPTLDSNVANFSGEHYDKLSSVILLETQIATTNDSIKTISNKTSTNDAPHIDVPKSETVPTTETSIGKSKRKRNVGNW